MRKIPWIVTVLVLFYLVRLVAIAWLQLAPDEAYYWQWSKHLDWSYFDHPPMVAYVMALFTGLGGNSEFFVRIGGLLISLLTIVVLYGACRRLAPEAPALSWEVIFIANVTLLFSAGCLIQTPDTPLLLFWALAVYCGVALITDPSPRWWYLWGISLGLGLLSKYTMILIVPCQFAFLLFSRDDRRWLFRKEPWLALLIGAAIFSPVVYWNWQHDWASFAYQLGHGFNPTDRHALGKLLEYLGGQAGIVTPLLFLLFLYYSITACVLYRRRQASEYLYLLMMSWPVILFFAWSSARGGVAQPNWPAPAYVAGLLLLGLVYSRYYRRRRAHRIFLSIAVGLALIVNAALHVHLFRPYLPVSPHIDTTQQFHGWRELGRQINAHIVEHPHPAGYFLLADRFSKAAEARYYSGKPYDALVLTEPQRYHFLGDADARRGKNALILIRYISEQNLGYYRSFFGEVAVIGEHKAVFRGEVIDEYSGYILLGKDYRGDGTSLKKGETKK
jgi:4-amino-4-deoxy-L-arabinose transferase-like glycosyltransferase